MTTAKEWFTCTNAAANIRHKLPQRLNHVAPVSYCDGAQWTRLVVGYCWSMDALWVVSTMAESEGVGRLFGKLLEQAVARPIIEAEIAHAFNWRQHNN
jgi:hypothetical protein